MQARHGPLRVVADEYLVKGKRRNDHKCNSSLIIIMCMQAGYGILAQVNGDSCDK
jgi:hypothetical protein